MPTTTLNDVWAKTQSLLHSTLKRPSIAKWIPELQPLGFDGQVLSIGVPSEVARDFLESKAAPLLAKGLSSAFDAPITVHFSVAQLSLGLDDGAGEAARRPVSAGRRPADGDPGAAGHPGGL